LDYTALYNLSLEEGRLLIGSYSEWDKSVSVTFLRLGFLTKAGWQKQTSPEIIIMGAGQSRTEDEKVFYNETPIQVCTFCVFNANRYLTVTVQFSQQVVDQLQASPAMPSERQSTLDAHVQSRIQAELARLQEQEKEVREQIETALEKENLDRERVMAGEEDPEVVGSIKSSASLMGDLDEVEKKVERYHSKLDPIDYPQVKEHGEALASCYRCALVYFHRLV
jgi:MICOS complex subunit MIC19